jgi:hypothetical protein
MWHVVEGNWNGQAAAGVYEGPMLRALRRTWGPRRRFTVVEDGDKKGNQSNKGIDAKERSGIHIMKLPPRTPCWMPLDYAIWHTIAKQVIDEAPDGTESKVSFLDRLEKCAKKLRKGYVSSCIARMKMNIQGVKDAKGYHPKSD